MKKYAKMIGCIVLAGVFLGAMQFFCFGRGRDILQGGKEQGLVQAVNSFVRERKERIGAGGKQCVVVIDAGHGGMDPGKVGVNGTLEKEINLAMAEKLKQLLEQNDITVVMTRTDDDGLYQENDANKKRADMQARVRILQEMAPVLAVSIHQNSFTDNSSRGAQVFYYQGSEQGKLAADMIQEAMRRAIADGNHRMAKANADYYMLKKSPCPLVIVECGFLSNPEEEALLRTESYQRKVAWAIHLGVMEWIDLHGG